MRGRVNVTRVGIDDWAGRVADGRESKHCELAWWLDVNVHGRLTLVSLITLALQPLSISITFMSLHASANCPVVCRLTRFCRYLLTALLPSGIAGSGIVGMMLLSGHHRWSETCQRGGGSMRCKWEGNGGEGAVSHMKVQKIAAGPGSDPGSLPVHRQCETCQKGGEGWVGEEGGKKEERVRVRRQLCLRTDGKSKVVERR
jgi:hypothetical protein